ncbi:hypothetical protein AB0C29_03930 [Actinoplanes sp. NPDC048791]|uniref:hypothetical protein n=1 Tax=Actinoplanes sp. NPDC048791 TaxID=3154623 RepID=UPI0034102F85
MGLSRDEAKARYVQERPVFEKLAEGVAQRIRELAIEARIDCTVSHRAKDVWSFVKKAIEKKVDDPWDQLHDKAGVRVVVRHVGELVIAEKIIRENFDVTWSSLDEPAEDDDEDRLRYPRLHFQARPIPSSDPEAPPLFKGYSCEIQLRTAATDLWASMSHKLLYKPSSDLPKDVRRSLYGLLALVEVYDREVQRAMEAIGTSPDRYLNATVDQCERIYYSFCTNPSSSSFTREVISIVMSTMEQEQWVTYPDELEKFAKRERENLQEIYDRYGPASEAYQNGLYMLLGQPESIAIFERLKRNSMTFEHAWQERLPEGLLEELRGFDLD